MIRPIVLLAALAPGLAAPVFAAEPTKPRPDVARIRAIASLDCTLSFTNDYIDDLVLMQDTTHSPEACVASCARYAERELVYMRDRVRVLRYTCIYRNGVVADVDLK